MTITLPAVMITLILLFLMAYMTAAIFLGPLRDIADALQRIANVKDAEFERRKKEAKP